MYSCGRYLRCRNSFGARAGDCWNHCQAPIAPLRAFVVKWLVTQCQVSEDFRNTLLKAVQQALHQQRSHRDLERVTYDAKLKDLEGQERNLRRSVRVAEAIAEEDLKGLVEDLANVTKQLRELRNQAVAAETAARAVTDFDDQEIIANLSEVLEHLLDTSFEMAEVVRRFVPKCVIVPVQSLDTGQVYPRAKLYVRGNLDDYDELTELIVDLFEPPVHIRLVPEANQLRSQQPQPTLKQIGAALGTSYMTVKRALAYARRMESLGVTTPFRELSEKPANASRWRDGT